MSKSNTGQYLKYAIGEILLVMIGILLALQVNNWNNTRLERIKEQNLLIQLQENIAAMLGDLKGDHELLSLGVNSHLNIREYIDNDVAYNDTMCFDFHWLIKDEYIYPVTSAYDQIKEEGMELIQNDSIRALARGMFEFALPRISKQNPFYPDLEAFFGDFYRSNFTPNNDPDLTYNFKLYDYEFKYPYEDSFDGRSYMVYFGYVPNDFEALKSSSEFKMLLRQAATYRSFKVSRYKTVIDNLTVLEEIIERELKRRYD